MDTASCDAGMDLGLRSLPEAARALRVSERTVSTLLSEGVLPRTRVGGRVFVTDAALRAFLERNTTRG